MLDVVLASPREPSGVTWLINCFLELGIRCFRGTSRSMWREKSGRSHLLPREEMLKRWLPALYRHEATGFAFRPDVAVEWTHDWPGAAHRGSQVIYFVRDPRDALYSRYRRQNPDLPFHEYAGMPDAWALCDRADTWGLFTRSWLAMPSAFPCRFEDYKADDVGTLSATLDALKLRYDRRLIVEAAERSTFEHARAAEQRYLAEHPDQRTMVVNRAGQVGSWGELSGPDAAIIDRLEARSPDLFRRFGYTPRGPHLLGPTPSLERHMDEVPWLNATPLRPRGDTDPYLEAAAARAAGEAFARDLDVPWLTRAAMDPYEGTTLLCNLRDWLRHHGLASDVDFGPALASYGDLESAYYYELFKRTRRLNVLRRIDPLLLARRVASKARRTIG